MTCRTLVIVVVCFSRNLWKVLAVKVRRVEGLCVGNHKHALSTCQQMALPYLMFPRGGGRYVTGDFWKHFWGAEKLPVIPPPMSR